MQRTAARQWLVATGIAFTLVGPLAAPALAEPTPATSAYLGDALLAPGSSGDYISIKVYSAERMSNATITVRYDASDVSGFAQLVEHDEDDWECHVAGDVATCSADFVDLDESGVPVGFIRLVPKGTAAPGNTGKLRVTVSAQVSGQNSEQAAKSSTEGQVTVGEGVDVVAERSAGVSAPTGASFTQLYGVRNVGDKTAHGVVAEFRSGFGIEAGGRFANCRYDGDTLRICTFDEDLLPGKGYGASVPLKLRPDTMAPGLQLVEVTWMTPAQWDLRKAFLERNGHENLVGQPGSGSELDLVEGSTSAARSRMQSVPQVDIAPVGNLASSYVKVSGNLKADVAAVGDTAAGSGGVLVDVTVGTTNKGPATINESFGHVDFTVPRGASVTKAAAACAPVVDGEWLLEKKGEPGYTRYLCFNEWFLPVGGQSLYSFTLRIDTEVPNSKGKVELLLEGTGATPQTDGDPANNIAYVVLNESEASAPTTAPGAPGNGGSDDEPGLPVTGVGVAGIAGAAIVLLAAGAGLLLMVRRRRVRFTV